MRVIDHIATLKLSDEQEKGYFNELRSLDYLARGLWFLCDQIQKVEAEVVNRVGNGYWSFGNAPEMRGIDQNLVACAFHWYAVTVCNYVKMVGWLANSGDSNRAREYMECVLPQVYLWRHKVAAHFAIIDPRRDDSAADLARSVMFPIFFCDDAFYAGSLPIIGKLYTGHQNMRWSLTHTHRDLIPRYWPECSPKK